MEPCSGTFILVDSVGDVFNVGHRFSWGVCIVTSQAGDETTWSLKSLFIPAIMNSRNPYYCHCGATTLAPKSARISLWESAMSRAGQAVSYHQGALRGWVLFPLLKEAEGRQYWKCSRLGGHGQVGWILKVCHLAGWEWQWGPFTALGLFIGCLLFLYLPFHLMTKGTMPR